MSRSHFKAFGQFNGTNAATVTIDRSSGVFSVRPRARRKTYELPLAFVAELVMWRCLKAELLEKKKAKAAKRKAGR